MRIHALAIAALLAGCSSSGSAPLPHPDASGTGGTAAAGTGGQKGTGGATGTGGTPASGGTTSSGGITKSGGTSGPPSTGGTMGTGAAAPTGGNSGTGGNTGGTSAAGGDRGTGGTTGTVGTAGTTGTGGGSGGNSGTGGSTTSTPDAGSDAKDATAADRAPDTLAQDTRDTRDAGADAPGADTTTTANVTVYVAGDSTVSTYTGSSIHQAGWGQFLQDYFITNAKVVNKAVGGMTSRHFIEAGYLDAIIAVIKPGDYLLVQFGTNDGNTTATYTLSGSTTAIPYYLDPQTDFKTYLTKYVDATNAKSATTIFVTPPPRHSCNAGETGVRNGLAAYATAMQELGPTLDTPVVDLNAMVIAYLASVTCETSGSTFYLVKADGTIDSTHFQETGANIMAGLVAKGTTGVSTLGIPLSAYVK